MPAGVRICAGRSWEVLGLTLLPISFIVFLCEDVLYVNDLAAIVDVRDQTKLISTKIEDCLITGEIGGPLLTEHQSLTSCVPRTPCLRVELRSAGRQSVSGQRPV